MCRNALAAAALDEGDHARAQSLFEQCLAAWEGLGDRGAVARALSNLASLATIRGDRTRLLVDSRMPLRPKILARPQSLKVARRRARRTDGTLARQRRPTPNLRRWLRGGNLGR